MKEHRCPSCGKPVLSSFKFCKSCGARLSKEVFASQREEKPERDMHSSSLSSPDDFSELDDFGLTPEVIHSLASKGRMELIDKEMDEILEEIENLEERVKVGLIPKEDAKGRVNELNKRFVEIKIERRKVAKGGVQIPILELIETKEQNKDRLVKLEDLRKAKSISQKTYEKMKNEYKSSIANSEKQITQELVKMERWKDILAKGLVKKREELETLFVRKSTGELSDKEYEEERADLAEEIKNYESALDELKKTLKKLK